MPSRCHLLLVALAMVVAGHDVVWAQARPAASALSHRPLNPPEGGNPLGSLLGGIPAELLRNETLRQTIQDALTRQATSHDSMPTQQWLELMTPFVDRALLDSMMRAAENSNSTGNLSNQDSLLPASDRQATGRVPSNARRPDRQRSMTNRDVTETTNRGATPTAADNLPQTKSAWSGLSQQAVESFMEAIDATGTEWMKSVNQQARARRGGSWWQKINRQSSRQLNAWRRRLNQQSRELSKQLANEPPVVDLVTTSIADPPNISAPAVAALLVLVIAVIGYGCWYVVSGSTAPIEPPQSVSGVTVITDRDSLLGACHQLALHRFGRRSCYWNHCQLFAKLSEVFARRSTKVRRLAAIYEFARYSSTGRSLSAAQLRLARRLFEDLQHDAAP